MSDKISSSQISGWRRVKLRKLSFPIRLIKISGFFNIPGLEKLTGLKREVAQSAA